LYFLKKNEIASLPRMGDKSALNLLRAIEKSKKRSLERLIFALGIPFVGTYNAKLLKDNFVSIDELKSINTEELLKIEGIGEKTASSIVAFFENESNLEVVLKLRKAGVRMEQKKEKKKVLPFEGMKFVLTGVLEKYTRDDAKTLIEDFGGRVTNSVSEKTDFVIVGEYPGSKFDKAKKLGIKIKSEVDFLKMIDENC
ncbi:NAD-dependent DNA ligase LigA, partial [candidate division WOR-3 bacterium]|nr:NAD-dependent DNA ligase LigA [candidate division WOR-3 bacterium]